jgi:hypothetical protein
MSKIIFIFEKKFFSVRLKYVGLLKLEKLNLKTVPWEVKNREAVEKEVLKEWTVLLVDALEPYLSPMVFLFY